MSMVCSKQSSILYKWRFYKNKLLWFLLECSVVITASDNLWSLHIIPFHTHLSHLKYRIGYILLGYFNWTLLFQKPVNVCDKGYPWEALVGLKQSKIK